jgi:hypothetical protein
MESRFIGLNLKVVLGFILAFLMTSALGQDGAVSVQDLDAIESDMAMPEANADTDLDGNLAEPAGAESEGNGSEVGQKEQNESFEEAGEAADPMFESGPEQPATSADGLEPADQPADTMIPPTDQPMDQPLDQPMDQFMDQPAAPADDGLFMDPAPAVDDKDFRTPANDPLPEVQKIEEPNLFAGAPPVPGTLRNMADGEAPEEYRVRMGDTLFDICDQLLDEPGYWPKLWALNPYIKNPHFIYPGMRLRFYPGDEESPPYLRVVTEDDMVPVDKGQLEEKELVREDLTGLLTKAELPNRTKVLGAEEVRSFPEMDEAYIMEGSIFSPDSIKVTLPAFVFEDEIDELGVVVGGTAGSILMDRGQDIIVEQEETLQQGTSYSVVRPSKKLYHPKNGNFVGYRYEFIGQIEVKRSLQDDLFAARVLLNRLGIRPGDKLISYRSVRRDVPLGVNGQAGQGNVVVGFDQPFLEVGGRGSFVLFETKSQPLSVGQSVAIFQNVKKSATTFIADQLPAYRKRVATAHIIEKFGPAAVGYIVNDRFEVRIGDDTGS